MWHIDAMNGFVTRWHRLFAPFQNACKICGIPVGYVRSGDAGDITNMSEAQYLILWILQ